MKKNLKLGILPITMLFFSFLLLTNCSKEDETNKNVSKNIKIDNYLKTFYSSNYQLGKSVETKTKSDLSFLNRSVEFEDIIVTEVFVGDDTRARGYIVTSKADNSFLYFVDVDRIDFKMTTLKVNTNETVVFNDINDLDKYLSTDEFDFIKITEDYIDEITENQNNRRPFWGSETYWGACGPNTNGTPGCFQGLYIRKFRFWIETSDLPVIPIVTQPCECP